MGRELPKGPLDCEELKNTGFHLEGVSFDKFSDSKGFICCQRKIKFCDEFSADSMNPGPISPGPGLERDFLLAGRFRAQFFDQQFSHIDLATFRMIWFHGESKENSLFVYHGSSGLTHHCERMNKRKKS